MDRLDETTEAHRHGELEAKEFDLRLRRLESCDREDRLTRLVAERPDVWVPPAPPSGIDAAQVERLQREVKMLAEYQSAVHRSKGWRFVQMLRRPLGRAW